MQEVFSSSSPAYQSDIDHGAMWWSVTIVAGAVLGTFGATIGVSWLILTWVA